MKFLIVVRSIGERTTKLCVKSCSIPRVKVILLENIESNKDSVKKQFEVALEKDVDFMFNVDADIVLQRRWFHYISKYFEKNIVVSFKIHDRFFGTVRGVTLYSKEFILVSNQYLNKLENCKPNSALIKAVTFDRKIKLIKCGERVGYHGYLQYYKHIFNRFAIRRYRAYKENLSGIFKLNRLEDKIAYYGWKYGHNIKIEENFKQHAEIPFNIKELAPLDISLEDFYKYVYNWN